MAFDEIHFLSYTLMVFSTPPLHGASAIRKTPPGRPHMTQFLDRWFAIRERGTSVRIEILGGATTFATMAYIIVVNPAILKDVIEQQPSTIATILAAVFGCLLMGFYAN